MNRSRGARGVILLLAVAIIVGCTSTAGPSSPHRTLRARPSAPSADVPTADAVGTLRDRLAGNPGDPVTLRDLGLALLQRVRETADPSLYDQAEEAFDRARNFAPDDPLVLVGIGSVQLGRRSICCGCPS
jgi:cytochrome c-type biogenesis protein CcmH/NrfG